VTRSYKSRAELTEEERLALADEHMKMLEKAKEEERAAMKEAHDAIKKQGPRHFGVSKASEEDISSQAISVLFISTANSCRGPMAAAWVSKLHPGVIRAHSVGISPAENVHPLALEVMKTKNVDVELKKNRTMESVSRIAFDFVVFLSTEAKAKAPKFSAKTTTMDVILDDAVELSKKEKDEKAQLAIVERVCDEIEKFATELPDLLMFAREGGM